MTMTPAQARVIDPILSTQARGYRQAGLIANAIFPIAPVAMYGGKILTFGKEAFRLYNTKRAPGANTKRVDFGYDGEPYAIVPTALEGKVPRELMRDASQVPGIDLGVRAVATVQRILALSHEYECAQIALNAANYDADHKITLAGTERWTGADSDPSVDVENGKVAIADSIGIEPNTVMLSRKALNAAKYHPKLIERIKYTNAGSLTTDMLKNLWEVDNIVIGAARVATGANDAFGDVWNADVWIGYVNPNPSPSVEEPSYGYSYQIEGMPMVEVPYWDANARSWIYGVSDDKAPVLSGMAAGYLIAGAGLPAA